MHSSIQSTLDLYLHIKLHAHLLYFVIIQECRHSIGVIGLQ